ncbi:hypothetical protein MAR_007335, partial [Mya arenaria]
IFRTGDSVYSPGSSLFEVQETGVGEGPHSKLQLLDGFTGTYKGRLGICNNACLSTKVWLCINEITT